MPLFNPPPVVGFVSGNWYPAVMSEVLFPGASAVMSNATTRLSPFTVREQVTVTDLGARVTTLSGGGLFRLGIYASNADTNKATGLPLGTVSGLSTDAAVTVSATLASAITLYPGRLYWAAVQVDNATAVFQACSSGAALVSYALGDPTLSTASSAATTGLNAMSAAVGYAAGMTDFTAEAQTPNASLAYALVWFKAA